MNRTWRPMTPTVGMYEPAANCPLCRGKGTFYDDSGENDPAMVRCYCVDYGTPPPRQTHCVRCVSEARGLKAAVSCQWCKAGEHRLCEEHKQ